MCNNDVIMDFVITYFYQLKTYVQNVGLGEVYNR